MRKTTPRDIAAAEADFAELAAAVARLRGRAAVARFLEELFTPSECVELSKRWALMRELLAGKSQRTIARELGLSLCKITRGARLARDPESVFRAAVLRTTSATSRTGSSAAPRRTPTGPHRSNLAASPLAKRLKPSNSAPI